MGGYGNGRKREENAGGGELRKPRAQQLRLLLAGPGPTSGLTSHLGHRVTLRSPPSWAPASGQASGSHLKCRQGGNSRILHLPQSDVTSARGEDTAWAPHRRGRPTRPLRRAEPAGPARLSPASCPPGARAVLGGRRPDRGDTAGAQGARAAFTATSGVFTAATGRNKPG